MSKAKQTWTVLYLQFIKKIRTGAISTAAKAGKTKTKLLPCCGLATAAKKTKDVFKPEWQES